jgi:exosortase A
MNRPMEAMSAWSTRVTGWHLALAAFTVAALVLVGVYWQTAASLVHVWANDGTYQYAFLIFPLAAWTAFGLRHRLMARAPSPSIWGLAAVALLVCLWYIGHALAINLPQHFAFVALFPALVLACWGWRALWVLQFPLAYLVVFAVPWGDAMVGPLQDLTAHFAVHALNLTGVPVLLNGREIMTPSATWMVEQACSGVKFFIACTALGCLFAYLMYTRAWKRIVFVVIAAVAPIIANGLRVYFTILIGENFGLEYASGTDHMVFGWQFFGTVLVVLLLIGWFFRDPLIVERPPPINDEKPAPRRVTIWPVVLALLVAGPAVAAGLSVVPAPRSVHLSAPEMAGWAGPQAAASHWKPSFKGAAGETHVAYQAASGGERVELFHAVYTGRPRRGHDLITYGNNVYDPAHSSILASASRPVQLDNGMHVTARELRLAGSGGSRLVWYWYCVDGHCTASPIVTKLWQAWQALGGGMSQSSVWAVSMPIVHGDAARVRDTLRGFARSLPAGATRLQPARVTAAAGGRP